MIENLHVKNFALIEEEEITFLDGLHILSGETGAGKSIILGALGLALGGKVSKDMLRDNGEEALVEVVFRITDEAQRAKLREWEIEDEDDQIILSRKLTEARSVAKINGETVPATKLRQVGSLFLDIYGQQEHQSLSQKRRHLELLDEYIRAEADPVKHQVKEAYDRYIRKQKEWDKSHMDEAQRAREISLLEHEVAEIEGAHLRPHEDEELEMQYKRLSHGRKIMDALSLVHQNTSGSDGASDRIGRSLREFHAILDLDPKIDEMQNMLGEIDGLLGDFNRQISQYLSDAEFDEGVFLQVEQRLNEINRLKDKYGTDLEAVQKALEEKRERLAQLESYGTYLQELEEDLKRQQQLLEESSSVLSDLRKKGATKLCQEVQQALLDLNFMDVAFSMDFRRLDHYGIDGYDEAEFLISTNPGEPLKPLKDIASGGEMSRVMLAIKTVLAANDGIDTLIFDEIDAGISGRTAQAVSEKLHVVAKNHQVICITHLPQIAAMADHHYLIEKAVVGQATVSSIQALSYFDSVRELARMLGGAAITQAVLDNAKEMKDLAMAQKEERKELS